MIVLLDTNILIDVLRRRQDRPAQIEDLILSGHTLATSAINIGEVYAGLGPGEEFRTAAFLTTVDCYPVTAALAQRAGLMKNAQARVGLTLSLPDVIIAATAHEHHLALMTDNRKDFPFPELTFFPQ